MHSNKLTHHLLLDTTGTDREPSIYEIIGKLRKKPQTKKIRKNCPVRHFLVCFQNKIFWILFIREIWQTVIQLSIQGTLNSGAKSKLFWAGFYNYSSRDQSLVFQMALTTRLRSPPYFSNEENSKPDLFWVDVLGYI